MFRWTRFIGLSRFLEDGEQLPARYRIAYEDHSRRGFVVAPLGLHWIIRGLRQIQHWSYRYRPTTMQQRLNQAFSAGVSHERERYATINPLQAAWDCTDSGRTLAILRSNPHIVENAAVPAVRVVLVGPADAYPAVETVQISGPNPSADLFLAIRRCERQLESRGSTGYRLEGLK